ncbi:hypothetical protein JNB_12588 [Janibacter sp. HTCC2649]|nr:hypothetical protein JNB_12588 [Janibacter sp. HTCC2649]
MSERLSGLSVGELLAELTEVEDSLHRLPGVGADADPGIHESVRRPLREREHAILGEFTARRHRRGLIAAPLVQEGARRRTSPPWV